MRFYQFEKHLQCVSIYCYRAYALTSYACRFIGIKGSVYTKELNSYRIGLVHQHARHFIVLEYQYGCHDVMCIRLNLYISTLSCDPALFSRVSPDVRKKKLKLHLICWLNLLNGKRFYFSLA